jgi:putative membrane protein
LSQTPVTPETWTTLYGQDPQILLAVLMAALGLALVLVIELAGKKARPAESGSA